VDLILEKSDKGAIVHVGKIPKGQQHDTLVSEAGSMRKMGWEPDGIFHALLRRNQDCEEPGPEANIRRIAYSMAKYPAGQPLSTRQRRQVSDDLWKEFNPSPLAQVVSGGFDPYWKNRLVLTMTDTPKDVEANSELIFTSSREFHDSLAFNEFSGDATWIRDIDEIGVKAGEVLTDRHSLEILVFAQRNMDLSALTRSTLEDGIKTVSERNSSHPVRNYLNGLEWDGEPRMDTWLLDYAGAYDTPLNRAIGRRWLISAVARIMEPGCKADCCLVLGGKQGKGKSTLLKNLANGKWQKWFSDSEIDFRSKDAYGKIQGVWIYELAEIDSYSKTEAAIVKRFMSSADDKYRPPYARRDVRQPRQCVFAGTVNPKEYLNDRSGARRFWTVDIPNGAEIQYDAILLDRDQLWAEAVAAYRTGEAWYLDTPELRKMQEAEAEKHLEYNEALRQKLEYKLSGYTVVTMLAVVEDILGWTIKEATPNDQKEIAKVLKILGFEVEHTRRGNKWVRKAASLPEAA
jgi:virulence-associated protein E/primase-like protein